MNCFRRKAILLDTFGSVSVEERRPRSGFFSYAKARKGVAIFTSARDYHSLDARSKIVSMIAFL